VRYKNKQLFEKVTAMKSDFRQYTAVVKLAELVDFGSLEERWLLNYTTLHSSNGLFWI